MPSNIKNASGTGQMMQDSSVSSTKTKLMHLLKYLFLVHLRKKMLMAFQEKNPMVYQYASG